MSKRLIGQKPFDFSARVTLQLGRESISSSTVAISELIKNSYDADAENVLIDFHLRSAPLTSTLVIKDDGLGMSLSTLMDNWLRIGTNNKVLIERSEYKNRILTGAKGLGRLGIDRLCKRLVLITKRKGEQIATQLSVNWRKFENTQSSLHEIVHDIYEIDLPIFNKYGHVFSDIEQHGTFLFLIGLKDNWNTDFISTLENELRLLISPYKGLNDFSIDLITRNKESVFKKSINSEEILTAASWQVKSSTDKYGRVTAEFKNNKSGEVVRMAPVDWNKWIKNSGRMPVFGPLKFEFYYIPRDKDSLSKIKLNNHDWKRFMELNRGVRIYRDDFRVRPYGEPTGKGDWLDLGYRRSSSPGAISQGQWKIGPHQIVGAVLISRDSNAILEDQANREGLFENDAFFQMRTFVLKVIEIFENLIHKDLIRTEETDLSEELAKNLQKSEVEFSGALTNLKATFVKQTKGKKKQIPPAKLAFIRLQDFERAKRKHEEALDLYYKALKKEKDKLQAEKDTLSNLASIGILTICFGHEIRNHSGLALENIDEIHDVIIDSQKTGALIESEEIESSAKIIKNSIRYVDNFSKLAINNIKPDKRQRKKINVPSVFDYIFNLMSATLSQMNIRYSFSFVKIKKEDFNVRSYEIDWESIVINFLTNSIWALESKDYNNRYISVIFERVGGTRIKVSFMDSGCGLELGSEDSIFLPMKSSKRDRAGNAIGTGMGLAIVRTHVVDHMAGNVSASASSELGGACFYIEIIQDV